LLRRPKNTRLYFSPKKLIIYAVEIHVHVLTLRVESKTLTNPSQIPYKALNWEWLVFLKHDSNNNKSSCLGFREMYTNKVGISHARSSMRGFSSKDFQNSNNHTMLVQIIINLQSK